MSSARLIKAGDGIATPITDLIVTYLEEVEGEPNAPTTEQGVLNKIFGDDVIMVADILDMGNYKVPESGAPGEVKKQMIIRTAIALAEIKKDETLAGGDGNAPVTKAEIIETIHVLLALPDDSNIARLRDAVEARVGEAVAVKGGKPIGIPDDVETTEDTDYAFPETLVDLIELFGFLDPSGNSSSADASAFRGVYIKLAIENGVLSLDDNTPVVESTAGLGDVSVPSITGYIYITLDKLDTLKLRPALDFNGNLELIYRVWDGEQSSSDVTLTITVTSVNDDPVATGSLIVGQNGQVGHAITAIDLSTLFTDIDDEIVTLDVFFFSSIKEVNIGLSYNVADGIIGRPTRFGLYTIEVVASDNRGGEATLEFPILILPDVESLTKVSGNGGVNAVVGNDEVISSQFLTGGDNTQTLNTGDAGGLIFGGRGDDIINLGDGMDFVIYRYDGADKTDSAAYDGGDVINNFNLSKDILVLAHVGGNVHNNAAAFFDAIKGFSLLVNDNGNITGIVFIFTDRETQTQDIDLTLNFEGSIFSGDIDLTAFNAAVDGRRTVKRGQETIAYQALESATEGDSLALINFKDIDFINEIDDAAPPSQILIGDDNIQTLNYGAAGNLIFGGRGDDIINLGDGADLVYYRYDGDDTYDSEAWDGDDVINNFDLNEDLLVLFHAEGNIYSGITTFFDAIKGVSLLDSGGKITGIVFTFIDRAEGAEDDDEIDLTVNLENDDFISSENIDLTAFNEEVSGRRTIKTGQKYAAYETIINDLFPLALELNVRSLVSGYGVNGVTIGDEAATSGQYLIGGNNAQTLNTGGGDVIFGGKGDDIINLGGGSNFIFYGYDGADKTDSAAYDGGDVINNFSLGYDELILLHVGNNVHSSTAEFYAAIKGVSLLVGVINGDENITGIVFTFTDRDTPTEEIDLTVNFEYAISPDRLSRRFDVEITALTAFNEEVSGRRTIKTGQEDAAYEVIDAILHYSLYLYNFWNNAPEVDTAMDPQIETVDRPTEIYLEGLLFFDFEDGFELTLTVTLDDGTALSTIGLSYAPDTGITGTLTRTGTYVIKIVATDRSGATGETTFDIVVSSFSIAIFGRELGRGVDGAVVNGVSTRAEEFLIGGDNNQTLNTGWYGDYVFGGRGDDTIDLGGAIDFGNGVDVVYYRYGGDDDGLEGIDGHDVIENFDLDEDFLVLARVGNGIHGDVAAFDDAIRFSTTPNSEGEITGFVITFTGGGSLTVNFDSDDFISGDDQSSNPSLSTVLGNRLQLIHFDNIGFKLNSAETNIIASPDITRLINQSGNGVGDAEVGAGDASSRQFLIGGDNDQTLNASSRGDVIFGGRGDDTINLGNGDGVVYYRYDGVDTDDLESIDGNDTIEDFDRGDDVLVLAYVGEDGDEIIDTTDFYGALKSIKLLVEEDDDDDLTGIVFTFTDRSDGAGANDEVVLTVNFYSVFSASSSQIRTIDNAFEDAASGSEERLVKSGEDARAVAVIEDIVLGEDLQLINFADIGFKLNSIETNAVVLPDVFTFAKELGDGDNASVGVDTAASSQFLLGGDNVQTLNAGTEGDAIFGGKGDDIINLGGGKDFVFYRYDGVNTDDSVAHDGADEINDFDLDEDVLVLAHESNDVHENSNAFYEAIKGISLLVDGNGNVTGIVFTFTDRSNTTQEVDLTVNFEDDLTPPAGLEAAFDNASSGEREITSGQETAAYGVINEIFGDNLVLIDFADIGFELNNAETDIV